MLQSFDFKYADYKGIKDPEKRFNAFYRDWLIWSQEPKDSMASREEFYRTQVRSNRAISQEAKADCVIALFY